MNAHRRMWIAGLVAIGACTPSSPFDRPDPTVVEARRDGMCPVRVQNGTNHVLRIQYQADVHRGTLDELAPGQSGSFGVRCEAESILVTGVGPFAMGQGRLVYRRRTAPDADGGETIVKLTSADRSRGRPATTSIRRCSRPESPGSRTRSARGPPSR